jgi:general secretion pathway protein M
MNAVQTSLSGYWQTLSARERQGVAAALTVIGVLLLWMVALRPAWRTLGEAPAQRQALQIQLLQMQQLAAESRELRALPPISSTQAAQALQATTARLGDQAKLARQGERTVVSFSGVQPEQLRSWLAEARSGARARPVDAQITRGAQGLSGSVTLATGSAP